MESDISIMDLLYSLYIQFFGVVYMNCRKSMNLPFVFLFMGHRQMIMQTLLDAAKKLFYGTWARNADRYQTLRSCSVSTLSADRIIYKN